MEVGHGSTAPHRGITADHLIGHFVDQARFAGTFFPGRPLVGHERGDALAAALDGGFDPVGELRVWAR